MNSTRHSSGTVPVSVQRHGQEEPTEWETYYETEEHDQGGLTLIVERPPFEDATDLQADVLDALYAYGVPTVTALHWI